MLQYGLVALLFVVSGCCYSAESIKAKSSCALKITEDIRHLSALAQQSTKDDAIAPADKNEVDRIIASYATSRNVGMFVRICAGILFSRLEESSNDRVYEYAFWAGIEKLAEIRDDYAKMELNLMKTSWFIDGANSLRMKEILSRHALDR